MRELMKRCLLAAFSILFVFLLFESVLWIVAPVDYHTTPLWQPDGHIRGRLIPLQRFETGPGHNPLRPVRSQSHTNRVNRYGFRGPDPSLDPLEGTVRIAVFGGSAAFSFHDPEEATWPQRLGVCLTERFAVPTEVINLALPGYHLGISKINYLINGRAFQPDIAIAYHTWNDLKMVGRIAANPEAVLTSPTAKTASIFNRGLRRISGYSQIILRARILYYQRRANEREGARVETRAWTPTPKARDWFESNFRDFVRFAQADDVVPVIATQATLVAQANLELPDVYRNVGNEMIGLSMKPLLELWLWANEAIKTVAAQHGVPLVDVYSEVPHDLAHLEDHVHPTPEGQIQIADIFCEGMSEAPEIQSIYANHMPSQQGNQ